jgi:hypothetical protein
MKRRSSHSGRCGRTANVATSASKSTGLKKWPAKPLVGSSWSWHQKVDHDGVEHMRFEDGERRFRAASADHLGAA